MYLKFRSNSSKYLCSILYWTEVNIILSLALVGGLTLVVSLTLVVVLTLVVRLTLVGSLTCHVTWLCLQIGAYSLKYSIFHIRFEECLFWMPRWKSLVEGKTCGKSDKASYVATETPLYTTDFYSWEMFMLWAKRNI